jgi:triacylglycerol lipase
MENRYPLVFVHGLLGWGQRELFGLPYFGFARVGIVLGRLGKRDLGLSRRALFPSVGPISSDHDRACELFYQLKGGDVCYGDEHAREHGHQAFLPNWSKGRRPMYPEWDADHPVHFIGQAQGASTVRQLQHLLAQGDFFMNRATGQPYRTDPKWVRSLTTISGILNGTPAAYVLGCSPEDGTIRTYSTAAYLARTALDLATQPSKLWRIFNRHLYSFELDQWTDRQLFASGTDNAAYDLSIHGAQAHDFVEDFTCTYYFSSLTSQTRRDSASGYFVPTPAMNPFFSYVGEELGRFAGPLRNLKYPITDFAPWWENDGLAPLYTQDYPKWGRPREFKKHEPGMPLEKGVWYIMDTLNLDHMNTVVLPRLTWSFQQPLKLVRFYKRLYEWLIQLE